MARFPNLMHMMPGGKPPAAVPQNPLAAHIARICKIEDITVISHSRGGRGWKKIRRVAIRPVKSEITYAIALHEIGHVIGPRQSGNRLDQEVGAWEYAIANALVWTPTMTAKMIQCLVSYLRWAERHKQMKVPPPDHPIHALARGELPNH